MLSCNQANPDTYINLKEAVAKSEGEDRGTDKRRFLADRASAGAGAGGGLTFPAPGS